LRFILTTTILLFSNCLHAQLKIEGKIAPSSRWESKLYIERIDRLGGLSFKLVDSISLKKDGSFSYTFKEDKQGMLYCFFQPLKGEKTNRVISGTSDHWFYISTAEKGNLKLSAKADSLYYSHIITNEGLNKEMLRYRDMFKPFRDISKIVEDSIREFPEKKPYFQQKYLPIAISLTEDIKAKLIKSLDTCQNEAMLMAGLFYLDRASYGQIEKKNLEKYAQRLTDEDVVLIRNTKKLVTEPEKNRLGLVLPNTALMDADNNVKNLTSFKTKYKVLDFWASWCGPCRQANRTSLPRFYDFLTQHQILFMGISIDEDKNKWREAIAKDKTKWLQVVEEVPIWQKLLDIQGVPQYIVLDEDNKVVFESSTHILVENFLKGRLQTK
jgi:thiol-disulfide isomerase/thioredoxin